MALADEQGRAARRAEFERRMDAGDYRGLYGERIAVLMEQAAKEKGVNDELGALRVVMARCLVELEDPIEQARTVATLARAVALILRSQQSLGAELVDGLSELVMGVLGELDGE